MPRLIATLDRSTAYPDGRSKAWRETRSFPGTATVREVWAWAVGRDGAPRLINVQLTFDQSEEEGDRD